MKFTISDSVFESFPDCSVGVMVATNVDNANLEPAITELVKNAQKKAITEFQNIEVFENPTIKAWRQTYKKFGAEKYRASVEALVKRSLKGEVLNPINKLVDLYNYISLKYVLPVGGETLDMIQGDLELKKADGSERFIPLFSTEAEEIKPGEVVYYDGVEVLCRRWNWREADRTKITESTKNAVFEVEGIIEDDKSRVKEAIIELDMLVKKYCGGETKTYFFDNKNKTAEIS